MVVNTARTLIVANLRHYSTQRVGACIHTPLGRLFLSLFLFLQLADLVGSRHIHGRSAMAVITDRVTRVESLWLVGIVILFSSLQLANLAGCRCVHGRAAGAVPICRATKVELLFFSLGGWVSFGLRQEGST